LDGDFDAAGLAVAIALKPDVPKNKSGKVLNRVQHGLNLQLNSWSPGRGLPLFKQRANYSKYGRPAILFYRLGGLRAVSGRGGERRRRTSEHQFASPPVATRNGLARPAQRRARDVRKKVLGCQNDGIEHNENFQKQPTKCATDPLILVLWAAAAFWLTGCTGLQLLSATVSHRGYVRTTDIPYAADPRQKMEPNAKAVIFFYGGSVRATPILLMMRLILFAFAGRQ
jgi:hypothetical protein